MGNARDFFCFLPEIPPQACWRLDILLFAMLGNVVFGGGNARDLFFGAPMVFGVSFLFFPKILTLPTELFGVPESVRVLG